MTIHSLSLKNFKNYQEETFHFSDRINVICGENAQGKTNLLESIFFLSCVKPIHAKKERDLIYFGETSSSITAEVNSFDRKFQIDIELSHTCLLYTSKRTFYPPPVDKKFSLLVNDFYLTHFHSA